MENTSKFEVYDRWESQADQAEAQQLTDWKLNFYPAKVPTGGNPYAGFKRADFSAEEMKELQKACADLGGKVRWLPDSGPGGPASMGLRGLFLDTHSDARSAAEAIGQSLTPALASRIRVSLIPKKTRPKARKA